MSDTSTEQIFAPRDQSKEQKPPVTSNTGLAVETAIEKRDSSMDAASTENWLLAGLDVGLIFRRA
jgi:hypothetical protein